MNELPSAGVESDKSESPCVSPLEEEAEPVFTDEQIALYEQRYENSYDLCIDNDFVSWMSIYHPGVLPSSSGVDNEGDTSGGVAGGNGSYTPELFSTPPSVSSPDVHPGMATPTDVTMRVVATPTDAGMAMSVVATLTDAGLATSTVLPIVSPSVATVVQRSQTSCTTNAATRVHTMQLPLSPQ